MSPSAALAEALKPLRANPGRAALLLDVDGTLAPIAAQPEAATVPEGIRSLLRELSSRYGLLACVSGRPATQARQIVALGSIPYVGNHGAELLAAGAQQPQPLGDTGGEGTVSTFLAGKDLAPLARLGVTVEPKGPITALHFRGARDDAAAKRILQALAAEAEQAGLSTHWGRKVVELRPPSFPNKGVGIRALLARSATALRTALYAGDEQTDLDAFAALDALAEEGRLERPLKVAVSSPEAPALLLAQADLVLASQQEMVDLLSALL